MDFHLNHYQSSKMTVFMTIIVETFSQHICRYVCAQLEEDQSSWGEGREGVTREIRW